jgi:hypothetical protein
MNFFFIFLLTQALFASGSTVESLPPALSDYPTWKLLSPPGYTVPSSLSTACIAPDPARDRSFPQRAAERTDAR